MFTPYTGMGIPMPQRPFQMSQGAGPAPASRPMGAPPWGGFGAPPPQGLLGPPPTSMGMPGGNMYGTPGGAPPRPAFRPPMASGGGMVMPGGNMYGGTGSPWGPIRPYQPMPSGGGQGLERMLPEGVTISEPRPRPPTRKPIVRPERPKRRKVQRRRRKGKGGGGPSQYQQDLMAQQTPWNMNSPQLPGKFKRKLAKSQRARGRRD